MKTTNEIDLNAVKKHLRILSGKDKPESRYATKLTEFQAKGGLENKDKEFLFYYSLWTLIQKGQHSTLNESEVQNALKQYPAMEIYYCRLIESPDRTPDIFKGKRIEKLQLHNHAELSDLIYQKAVVKVPESDLMLPAKNEKPLIDKVRGFVKDAADRQIKDATIKRIYNCLLLEDSKKRKQCLNDCKIK